jgi:putative transposase
MIEAEWLSLPSRFPNIRVNEFVVMPNHFHGILEIVGATLVVAQKNISDIEKGHPQGVPQRSRQGAPQRSRQFIRLSSH